MGHLTNSKIRRTVTDGPFLRPNMSKCTSHNKKKIYTRSLPFGYIWFLKIVLFNIYETVFIMCYCSDAVMSEQSCYSRLHFDNVYVCGCLVEC